MLTHTPVSHSAIVVALMMFLLILLRMSGRMAPVMVLLLVLSVVSRNLYRLELYHLATGLAFDTRGTV